MPGLVAAEAGAGKEKATTNSNINAIVENLFIMDIIAHFSHSRNLSPASGQKMEEIRYEKKSNIFLWINILGLVPHHHPDHIDQLAAQADQGLGFGFAFGHLSFEVRSGRVIARP